MVHKFTQYEQKLLDTVVSLRKEVSNLSESYRIVNARLNEISLRMNNDASDSLREAINIEELARLAAVAAAVAHQAAVVLFNVEGIEKTAITKKAAEDTHAASIDSEAHNRARQKKGGGSLKINQNLDQVFQLLIKSAPGHQEIPKNNLGPFFIGDWRCRFKQHFQNRATRNFSHTIAAHFLVDSVSLTHQPLAIRLPRCV